MARCGPGLGAPFSAQRVRAQPAAGARAPVSFVRISRPRMAPSNAFNRSGSCYNNYDEQAMKVGRWALQRSIECQHAHAAMHAPCMELGQVLEMFISAFSSMFGVHAWWLTAD